jgi:resuscitation-promoting factor RpfB
MTTTGPTTTAGWYPDPTAPGLIRYWDGRRWTEHSLQAPPAQASGWAAPEPLGSAPRRPRPWWRRWWAMTIAGLAVLMVIAALSPDSGKDTRKTAAVPPPSPPIQTAGTAVQKVKVRRATVPVLTGMSFARAREALRAQHLRGGYVERRPSAAQPGTVLSQGLHSGKQVAWRSSVPLVIAIAFPRVPATSGRSAGEASAALRGAGYRVRTVHKTVTSGTEGIVLSQSPLGGQPMRANTLVTIVVAHVVRPLVTTPPPSSSQGSNCTPGYSPCLAPASDYDCGGGSGDGPKYVYGVEHITGSDIYGLDADGDGLGCE